MGDHEAGELGPPWAKQWEWGPLKQQLKKKSSVRRDKTLILNITFLAKSQGDSAFGEGSGWKGARRTFGVPAMFRFLVQVLAVRVCSVYVSSWN